MSEIKINPNAHLIHAENRRPVIVNLPSPQPMAITLVGNDLEVIGRVRDDYWLWRLASCMKQECSVERQTT